MIRITCQWVSKCISQKHLFWMLAQGKQACIAAWKTTTLIFHRIPRTSPLIQSKFSHCVESIFFFLKTQGFPILILVPKRDCQEQAGLTVKVDHPLHLWGLSLTILLC